MPFNNTATPNCRPHTPAYYCFTQIQRCLLRSSFTVAPSRTSYRHVRSAYWPKGTPRTPWNSWFSLFLTSRLWTWFENAQTLGFIPMSGVQSRDISRINGDRYWICWVTFLRLFLPLKRKWVENLMSEWTSQNTSYPVYGGSFYGQLGELTAVPTVWILNYSIVRSESLNFWN